VLSWNEFLLRLGAAVPGGALIGFERQWRSRGAGLRTNTLVAAGAAMFVLIAQMTPRQTGYDPTRITSYVVSGVGFLGAGVIISDGARVRGINTAATLWCAAAVRALLLQSISGHGYQLRALESADIDGTDLVEVRAELATVGRNDEQIEAAAGHLGLEPNVTSVRWHVVERDGLGAFSPDHTSDG
jgi:putative Mg2+ transporter-C (MgtC) family protein